MNESTIYSYIPHHRTSEKIAHAQGPVKVVDQLPRGNAVARFNSWFAVRVTNGVGTMWCAYAFAALALVSLPRQSLPIAPSPWCRGSPKHSFSSSCCQ
jgi:hypothetical protein